MAAGAGFSLSARARNILWVVVWIGLSLAFGLWILVTRGTGAAAEYYAAYFLEKSLSVDNIFVFVIVFSELHIPGGISAPRASLRHRRCPGVPGAADRRRHRAHRTFQLGDVSVRSVDSVRGVADAVRRGTEREVVQAACDVCETWIARVVRVSPVLHGGDFWRREGGRLVATPLFVALVVIETTDIVFALDSVPAVLSVTRNPLIVYSSNVMAMLGLRSLYFVLADALSGCGICGPAWRSILVFTATKMLTE